VVDLDPPVAHDGHPGTWFLAGRHQLVERFVGTDVHGVTAYAADRCDLFRAT
jgi:hypothetical protein